MKDAYTLALEEAEDLPLEDLVAAGDFYDQLLIKHQRAFIEGIRKFGIEPKNVKFTPDGVTYDFLPPHALNYLSYTLVLSEDVEIDLETAIDFCAKLEEA
jgi:hypothetical protein